MKPSAFTLLDLSEYEISPKYGFLPQDPLEQLSDSRVLTRLEHELPKLLSAPMVRRFINDQSHLLPSIPAPWRDQDYQGAMRNLKS